MLKRIHIIYKIFVLFCVASITAFAQKPTVDVKNATGKQRERVMVRVEIDFWDILPESASTASVRLSYFNPRLIFRGVTGGSAAAGCTTPTVVQDPLDETSGSYGFLTITCNDVQRSNDNAVFDIEFDVIAGPDTVALIEPRLLTLNGDTVQDVELSTGVVSFTEDEPRVFPTYPEGLGINTPNPFYLETKVTYTVERTTDVRFQIFDHLGKKVLEETIGNQARGVYSYTISTFKENSEWIHFSQSSGLYLVVMETNSGVYTKKILFLK
jgi:hypothetical protein